MRARRAGYAIRYVPEGKVWHKISQSSGGQIGFRKMSLKLRSTIRFFARYARARDWLTIPFFFAVDVLRIAALVLSGKIKDADEGQS
jgi:GT2 family glycosyltransferase